MLEFVEAILDVAAGVLQRGYRQVERQVAVLYADVRLRQSRHVPYRVFDNGLNLIQVLPGVRLADAHFRDGGVRGVGALDDEAADARLAARADRCTASGRAA